MCQQQTIYCIYRKEVRYHDLSTQLFTLFIIHCLEVMCLRALYIYIYIIEHLPFAQPH